jgi:hypothetical protein
MACHARDKRLTCPDRQMDVASATGLIFKVLEQRDPAIIPGTSLA